MIRFLHTREEYPVLSRQTHKVQSDGRIISEPININENLIHYVRDTALLISVIDGTCKSDAVPYDHIVYLDKSARPVSWLVNLFWEDFSNGKRPVHTYVNIDRAPWFRYAGIPVSDDGRQKENGELATYSDFLAHRDNITSQHLASIRALFIKDGLTNEDPVLIMQTPTVLDGKRVLIVDEVSRTGATLNIAKYLFEKAIPDAAAIDGTYFWHPTEMPLQVGREQVMTSIPVWYDPDTETGRGIGSLNPEYYQNRYERCKNWPGADLPKLRKQAFASIVFSTPLLKPDGTIFSLKDEIITRKLVKDLQQLHADYRSGRIFFNPPIEWDRRRRMEHLTRQGIRFRKPHMSDRELKMLEKDPMFYTNFIDWISRQ